MHFGMYLVYFLQGLIKVDRGSTSNVHDVMTMFFWDTRRLANIFLVSDDALATVEMLIILLSPNVNMSICKYNISIQSSWVLNALDTVESSLCVL
jgi:hypothetical protein